MQRHNGIDVRQFLIRSYNQIIGGMEEQATQEPGRAYGGVLRSTKGKLVEVMAPLIIDLAWQESGGAPERISRGNAKTYRLPIKSDYVDRLPMDVRDYINARKDDYFYRSQVDVHVSVDNTLIMGIECKSYAENAMIKRILVDFRLLKSLHPELICCLLQLESQLGGDYSDPSANPNMGSRSTHTLMSYFPEVDLNIMTLLDGERNINRPIHRAEHFKELRPERLERVINQFKALLTPYI